MNARVSTGPYPLLGHGPFPWANRAVDKAVANIVERLWNSAFP